MTARAHGFGGTWDHFSFLFLSSSFFFPGERGVGGISFFGKKFLFGKVGGRGEKQGNMEIIGKFAFQKALGALG